MVGVDFYHSFLGVGKADLYQLTTVFFLTTQRIRGFLGIDIIQYARFDLIGLFFCPPLIALRLWALGAWSQQMQAAFSFTLPRPSSTIYLR
jgi:hypothetical protein